MSAIEESARPSRFGSSIGPYVVVPTWLIVSPISDRALRLFAILAKYADKENQHAVPKRSTLATILQCSPDSIDRAILELSTVGAVTVERRQLPGGNFTSNLYRLRFEPNVGSRTGAPTPSRTHAATLAAPVPPPVAAPVRGGSRTGAATQTRSIDPDPVNTPLTPLTGGTALAKPTRSELKFADNLLRDQFNNSCPHEDDQTPRCETRSMCLGALVMMQRKQVLSGMQREERTA